MNTHNEPKMRSTDNFIMIREYQELIPIESPSSELVKVVRQQKIIPESKVSRWSRVIPCTFGLLKPFHRQRQLVG